MSRPRHSRTAAFSPTEAGDNQRQRAPVEWVSVASLRAAPRNTRTHSKKQIRQIAESIRQFGFINPVITTDTGQLLAGHGRLQAAQHLGLPEVPVLRVSHLSETEIRAYMLADNRLAEKAGWDRELLAIELQELSTSLQEIELEIGITGFEASDIDALLTDFDSTRVDPAEDIPDISPERPVCRLGDLWKLGGHRLFVGDARSEASFSRLFARERAQMAVLDAPYNVRVAGHAGGRGRTKHREFVCASGEMTSAEFTEFLRQSLTLCAKYSVDGAIHFAFMDWRHLEELLAAGKAAFSELKNVCAWIKNNAGQGSFYRSQHELVFVFKHGRAPHVNNFELGQFGRSRSNVWEYAGCNSFHKGRMDELRLHPTVKPVQMLVDAMLDCSRRGDIVLDAFAGSGSTILAAERIGRRAYCIELDPLYADVCVRRWQQFTKRDAILEGRGTTYDEIADNVGNEATEPVVVSRQTCTAVVGVELSTSQSPRSRRAGAKNG